MKSLFLTLPLFFCSFSLAKIHIEPYFGYSFTFIGVEKLSKELYAEQKNQLEKIQKSATALSNIISYHGITPGMRLGYSSLNLAVGVDISFGYWKSLYKEGLEDFKGQQVLIPVLPGLFVSYKLPLFFKAYGTLIPQIATVNIKTIDQSQSYNKSSAMKIGFSYLSLPFLSINFEWMPMFIGRCGFWSHKENGDCGFWSHTGSIYGNITF